MKPFVKFEDPPPMPESDGQYKRIQAERMAKVQDNIDAVNASRNLRTFETGASRDTDDGKLDFEAFLCPLVLERYAQYMHKNRVMKDGSLRDGDNWQKGMKPSVYLKSLWRHFFDVWAMYRGTRECTALSTEEALCAVLFNAMGLLHEHLKAVSTR